MYYYKPLRCDPPKWISAKRPERCENCRRTVAIGERFYFFPYARTVYCDGPDCGQAKERTYQEAWEAVNRPRRATQALPEGELPA